MSPQPSTKMASPEELRLLWKMAGLAFQFGTEIIAGLLLGWGVDAFFGTGPWGVMIGTIAGILVGTLHLVRQSIRINREMDRAEAGRFKGGGPGSGGGPVSGGPIPGGGEKEAQQLEEELLESEFDEALNHDQWKKAQDRRLSPGSDLEDDDDDRSNARSDGA